MSKVKVGDILIEEDVVKALIADRKAELVAKKKELKEKKKAEARLAAYNKRISERNKRIKDAAKSQELKDLKAEYRKLLKFTVYFEVTAKYTLKPRENYWNNRLYLEYNFKCDDSIINRHRKEFAKLIKNYNKKLNAFRRKLGLNYNEMWSNFNVVRA